MYITQMKASFHANVYGNGCNALRERLQCFTGTVANVCRNGCNALRLRWAKAGTEIVSPILYKRKGEERFTIWGTVVLPKNLLNRFDVGPCMIYDKCGK